MKACGISTARMATPVLLFSLSVVFLSLALNLEWVPWGQRMFKTTLIKLGNTKAVSSIKEGSFTSGFFDLLIYADKVNSKTQELERVFIFDEREKGNPLAVVSKHGEMISIKTGSDLGASAMLRLYDGNIHQNSVDNETYQKIDFKEYNLFLKIPEGLDDSVVKPKTLPYHELLRRVDNAHNDPQAYREASTELWRRWATAFSPLIFVFLGIGFGTFRTRSVRAGAALIAFVVVLVYWMIQTWATSLSYDGKIPGWFAMQLPNLAILWPAIWSFRKSAW